jgi:hypothetical protein
VSIDKFYEYAFGQSNAFYKLCEQLPYIIDDVIEELGTTKIENTVIDELCNISHTPDNSNVCNEDFAPYGSSDANSRQEACHGVCNEPLISYGSTDIQKKLYLLAFKTYEGFENFR